GGRGAGGAPGGRARGGGGRRIGLAVLAAGGQQGGEAEAADPGQGLPPVDGATPWRSRGGVRLLSHGVSLAAPAPVPLRPSSEFTGKPPLPRRRPGEGVR